MRALSTAALDKLSTTRRIIPKTHAAFGVRTRLRSSCKAHVQAVVQPAFNDPVLAFELEQAQGLQLLQGLAANKIDDFTRPLAVALDSGLQPGN